MTTTETAAAVAIQTFVANLLREATERFGSVEAGRDALTALMTESLAK